MTFTKKDALKRLFLCPGKGPYVARSHAWRCDECPGIGGRLFLTYFISLLAAAALTTASLSTWADSACSSEYFDEISKIRYIHDGDTLHLTGGRKVRLIGINTPELARDNKAAETYAIEAKKALSALFEKNRSIALIYGKDKKDRYGRLLAHAFLTDGRNVQSLLLTQGFASAIIIPPNTKFAGCYLGAEKKARCKQAGLWQEHSILDAGELKRQHIGFHLVRGKVENIDTNEKGIWLNLDNKLTVGIRPQDQALFDLQTINKLLNQNIVVRGWINKSNKATPFYLRIKHPLSLQPASDLSCP